MANKRKPIFVVTFPTPTPMVVVAEIQKNLEKYLSKDYYILTGVDGDCMRYNLLGETTIKEFEMLQEKATDELLKYINENGKQQEN